jgi:hypothetical protein
MDYGRLPLTGAAGLTIGAIVIDQLWLLAVAVGLVTVGVLLIRFGWRRGKTLSDL